MSYQNMPDRSSGVDGRDLLEEIREQRGISRPPSVSQQTSQQDSDPYPQWMVSAMSQSAKKANQSRDERKKSSTSSKSSKYSPSVVPPDYRPKSVKKKTAEEQQQNQGYIDTFLKYGSSPKTTPKKFKTSRSYIKGTSTPVADMLLEYGGSPKKEPTDEEVTEDFRKMALFAINKQKKESHLPGRVPSQSLPSWDEPDHYDNIPGVGANREEHVYDTPYDRPSASVESQHSLDSAIYHNLPHQGSFQVSSFVEASNPPGYPSQVPEIPTSNQQERVPEVHTERQLHAQGSEEYRRSEGPSGVKQDIYTRYEDAYDSMGNTEL